MSNIKLLSVLRAPHVSEKTARLQEINQYVFEVALTATKGDVKSAVESLFKVTVEAERGQREGQAKDLPFPRRPPRRLA